MRYYRYSLFVLCLLALTACKKDAHPKRATVTVTIMEKGTITNSGYAAIVENADPAVYSFLCTLPDRSFLPPYSCVNAVYILNLPASLGVPGKKITFSRWEDHGQNMLLSSINHAHELDVYDAKEQ